MKISRAKKNSGIAVIVALVAVTVLTLLAGTFAYSMKVETRLAQNSDNDEQLLWLGRACLLYTSPSPRDGLLSRMPSSA